MQLTLWMANGTRLHPLILRPFGGGNNSKVASSGLSGGEVAARAVVECYDQVEHDRTEDREQDLVKGQGQEGAGEDEQIDGELKVTRADAEMFLQEQGEDIDPAQARTMAKQHQKADPHQRATGDGGEDRVEHREIDPHRHQL